MKFKLLSCPDPSPAILLQLAKSFSLKLLPDHLKLCLLYRHSQKRDQLVILERSLPTMSRRLATMAPPGTLRNDQQMTVSRRTAAVWQISPVHSKFAVSIPTSKRRVVEYARHHGIRAAARKFNIARKNVRRWFKELKDKNSFQAAKPSKRLFPRGRYKAGRKLSYLTEVDDKLLEWLLSM